MCYVHVLYSNYIFMCLILLVFFPLAVYFVLVLLSVSLAAKILAYIIQDDTEGLHSSLKSAVWM